MAEAGTGALYLPPALSALLGTLPRNLLGQDHAPLSYWRARNTWIFGDW